MMRLSALFPSRLIGWAALSLVWLLWLAPSASAQLGLGLGSGGMVLRYASSGGSPAWLAMARLDPVFSGRSTIASEVNFALRLIDEDAARLYLGAGLGAVSRIFDGRDRLRQVWLNLPVGVEFFPFSGYQLSVSAETGLRFIADDDDNALFIPWLMELTFYLE